MLTAEGAELTPSVLRQGETIRVRTSAAAEKARMAEREVRLFPQADGTRLGLMPVPADHKPGTWTVEFLSASGAVLHRASVQVLDGRFRISNIRISREIAELQPSPGEMETVRELRNTVSEERRWSEQFVAPTDTCVTSPFGVRRFHNGKPTGNYHRGLDQRGPAGIPVRAFAAGVVRFARMWNIHGGTVGIDHGQGLTSIYLHMEKFAAVEGASVAAGDVIGYVGSTGRSTAPHLHWGVQVNGVAVNPAQWVTLKPCAAPTKKTSPRKK